MSAELTTPKAIAVKAESDKFVLGLHNYTWSLKIFKINQSEQVIV